MTVKSSFFLLFAWIAIVGILNCTLIEPAFACHEDEVNCQTENETHGCLTCHSGHHQWIPSDSRLDFSSLSQPAHRLFSPVSVVLEPPLRSIFHPPLVA